MKCERFQGKELHAADASSVLIDGFMSQMNVQNVLAGVTSPLKTSCFAFVNLIFLLWAFYEVPGNLFGNQFYFESSQIKV